MGKRKAILILLEQICFKDRLVEYDLYEGDIHIVEVQARAARFFFAVGLHLFTTLQEIRTYATFSILHDDAWLREGRRGKVHRAK